MIHLFSRKNIDPTKWNTLIAAAINGMPYAYTWYLDIVCQGQWSALVKGDYEAVMPLPFNRKLLGFKQVYHPYFSQQLGVFSQQQLTSIEVDLFVNAIPTSYVKVITQINEGNPIPSPTQFTFLEKKNYCLDLGLPYAQLYAAYSKGLKYNIKQAQKHQLYVESLDWQSFLSFYEQHPVEPAAAYNKKIIRILKELLPAIMAQKIGQAYGVFGEEEGLCAGLFLLQSHGRLIYLLARSNKTAKRKGAMPFLVDTLIQNHANTQQIFDFEGSSIPGLAKFFESFGAEARLFYRVEK